MNVVEFITPEPINIADVVAAIDNALNRGIVVVQDHMDSFTKNWQANTKPKWKKEGPKTDGTARVVELKTADTPFVWVNEGTEGPYPIPKSGPHPTGLGPFQVGFIPKTRPGRLFAQPSRRFGEWIKPKRVTHPGIEGRDATGTSAKILDKTLHIIAQHELNQVRSL